MLQQFPRTMVGGVSLPRILIGTNWLLGWSHTGAAADKGIQERFQKPEDFYPVFRAYLDHGINAVMGPISSIPLALDAVRYAEQKYGQKMIIIDTPSLDVDDNAEARARANATVKHSAEVGCTFCLIHHTSQEQLVNKNKEEITRLPDYLAMIRDAGLIPGLSAHMPEAVLYSDKNEYDVETYIQIFNCMGFLMQVEVEAVAKIIRNAKKPVMTIKPFAAGRTTPFVGLTFNWNAIRPCDMITVGASTELEAREDIEYSFAALEHRAPNVEGRGSPVNQEVLGHM
ncbi:MAG: hypothetical protein J6N32_13240 [Clostridia bacterium]|nr:hypothetical protein [Clostridia bacterium]MBO5257072.1 hypothetical protein [Clostridia bacterium]MBP3294711.1 hypothetical protein [Clostridia bacterium]